MTKEKNLNNKEAIATIVNYIAWKYINKHEEETFEYNIDFKLVKEDDESYTMVCHIEENGVIVLSFPVGKNYKERGARIKAEQLIRALVNGENNIKSAGWEKINLSDLLSDLDTMDEENEEEENKMRYAQVIGQDTGKVFESMEQAVKHYGTEENIFPVLYPTEWLDESKKGNTLRIDKVTTVMVDGEFKQCHIMGIDVSYPQE